MGQGSFCDDSRQHVVDAQAGLCGNGDRLERIQPQIRIDLLAHALDVRGRQIDLVDHRQKLQIIIQGQIEVGDRLRLNPLGSIDNNQRAFAGHEGTPHFVRKIDMPRGVDEIQQIVLTVRRHGRRA